MQNLKERVCKVCALETEAHLCALVSRSSSHEWILITHSDRFRVRGGGILPQAAGNQDRPSLSLRPAAFLECGVSVCETAPQSGMMQLLRSYGNTLLQQCMRSSLPSS
jgi:hypothetical protein